MATTVKGWQQQGVDTVRLMYSDLHGVARGKDIPLALLDHAAGDGLQFCSANLADGLSFSLAALSERLAGGPIDPRFPDMRVVALPETLAQLPWEPSVAWCMATIDGVLTSPRTALERAVAGMRALGLAPVCATEFEFYLLRKQEHGYARYTNQPSLVYTVGERSDPEGVVREMVRSAREVGLDVVAAHHECGRGQFEINLNHGDALAAGDRAFRFKFLVKELAAKHGLIATFMGKPFADDAGSGLHLHVSATGSDGTNAFHDASDERGVSAAARHFLAGVLAHAPALTAFGSPTINSYKRIVPGTLVPTEVGWGYDNRTAYARVPPERGAATRLELRAADAAANPYLVLAANLFAGADGVRRKIPLPAPLDGPAHGQGQALPGRLEDSLRALHADQVLVEAMSPPLVHAFSALKSVEADRFRTAVTDWELQEYAWHL